MFWRQISNLITAVRRENSLENAMERVDFSGVPIGKPLLLPPKIYKRNVRMRIA